MTSLSWTLLAHVVDVETWVRLVVPGSVHPLLALVAVAVLAVVGALVARAAGRVARVLLVATRSNPGPGCPTPPECDPLVARPSVLLISGHGARAPGGGRGRRARRLA